MAIRWPSVLLASLIVQILLSYVVATRTRVGTPQEDPPTKQVYNDLRHLRAHPNYYYLEQAGVPVAENETNEVLFQGNTIFDVRDFSVKHFKFNSSEHIRRAQTHKWFMSLDERIAMHIYDSPREMELAAGPQVNQELCGVHLSYMIHMARKHLKHITDSTDLAIFKLMNAFDLPHHGLAEGNSIFPGSYEACSTNELSLIKHELREMFAGDKRASDKYFTLTLSLGNDEHRVLTMANLFGRIKKFAQQHLKYVYPFVGYFMDDSLATRPISLQAKSKLTMMKMRYCFAGLRWPSWSNSSWSKRHMNMRVATCLPETCDSNSLKLHRDKIMKLVDMHLSTYHSQYYIENLFCLPDENSEFRNPFNYIASIFLMVFIGVWMILIIVATALGDRKLCERDQCKDNINECVHYDEPQWWAYLKCWSIQKNLSELFSGKQKSGEKKVQIETNKDNSHENVKTSSSSSDELKNGTGCASCENSKKKGSLNGPSNKEFSTSVAGERLARLDFSPLEGLKVLGSISVMTSHAIMLLATATQSPITFESMWHSWWSIIATLCPSVVDVFFVITGAMTVKTIAGLMREHSLGVGFWLKYIIYRYLRIVPLYLFIHLFLQHGFRFLGSGPFWDYGTSHSAWSRGCQVESIWLILLPSANFVAPSIHCNGVGWYLANDLQLTLLVPFVVPLLLKRPRLGHTIIGLASVLGTAAHIKYFWDHDPDARGLLEWTSLTLTRITDDTTAGYVYPQYRFVAYFIGLSLGHLLDVYERGQTIKQWPRWLVTGGKWFFYGNLYILCALPFLTSLALDSSETLQKCLSAIIQGASHLTSSLAISAFVLTLVSGHFNEMITQAFGSRVFKLFAKMAHSTMLVHLPLMFYHQQTMRTLPLLVTKYDIFKTTLVWELEVFALSFVVHIVFENPMRRSLIKLMLNIFSTKKQQKPDKFSKASRLKATERKPQCAKVKNS